MNQITIDKNCIRCGRCISVCPAGVFSKDAPTNALRVHHAERCIACGQCVAMCPPQALHHSAFPAESIRPFRQADCPSPEATMLLLKKRRSNRTFLQKPVPEDKLMHIAEAAHNAPTARNTQDVEFTIITSAEKLRQLCEFVTTTYQSALDKLNNPFIKPLLSKVRPELYNNVPVLQHVVDTYRKGDDCILRNAPTVILFHTKANGLFSSADANLAYQNASIMAESMEMAHFYLGYLCSAIKLKKGGLEQQLGIDGTVQAAMAIGYPRLTFTHYIDRGKPEVKIV